MDLDVPLDPMKKAMKRKNRMELEQYRAVMRGKPSVFRAVRS